MRIGCKLNGRKFAYVPLPPTELAGTAVKTGTGEHGGGRGGKGATKGMGDAGAMVGMVEGQLGY